MICNKPTPSLSFCDFFSFFLFPSPFRAWWNYKARMGDLSETLCRDKERENLGMGNSKHF